MRYRYRRHKRRPSRGLLLLLLLLTAVFLVSCVAGSNPLWIRSVFGLDTVNYESEPTQRTLGTEDTVTASLCNTLEILLASSTDLTPFQNTAQAVKYYRDEILNRMLCENYAAYVGNSALLESSGTNTPYSTLCTLIPEADFENTVYRYFGGTSVKHASGEIFSHLSLAHAYSAPIQPRRSDLLLQVHTVEETEHTYRLVFTLSDAEVTSRPYTAVFVKRENGSHYLYSLD
ncbi:MAG: hypothetical protein IKA05_07425 [Clostridia bacterium]|nr:hypothetical protein [Clostridia bacterium]